MLVVHRDVKPSNIVITRDRRAFLIDFGLAAPPDSKVEPAGTIDFCPDEILIHNQPPAYRHDWISLAMTLYAMYLGLELYDRDKCPPYEDLSRLFPALPVRAE